MIQFKNQNMKGVFLLENVLFELWAKDWLEEKRHYVKESTYANYRTIMINHLIPEFGLHQIIDINCEMIQKAVIHWSNQGRLDKKGGLSIKSIRDMIVVLKMCLRDAELDEGQITGKTGISYPRKENTSGKEIFALSEQAYSLYINAILQHPVPENIGFILCLYTGMRIGEICALQWGDINMEEKVIHVNKTIQRIYIKNWNKKGVSRVVITTPKSPKSIRIIPISDTIFGLLKRHRQSDHVYVVTGQETFIEPRLYRKHYVKFVNENSLEYIKFHGLRHTFATRCIEAGADYKTVSELLGHASVNLTLNLYVHPHLEEKRKCVNLL